MLIRDLSAVFVHIPKTAGNSTILKLAGLGLLSPHNLMTSNPLQDGVTRFGFTDEISLSKHATAEHQISRLIQLLEKEPGLLPRKQIQIVFTLRHPVERLSSLALHGSNGKFSFVRIIQALSRPSVTQKVLLSEGLLLKLRELEISIEWIVLDFYNLEESTSRWLGPKWNRSDYDSTGEAMPRVNVSKASAFTKAVTQGLMRIFIYVSPSALDLKLKPGKYLGEKPTA